MHLDPVMNVFGEYTDIDGKKQLVSKSGYSVDYTMCYNADKWNPKPTPDKPNQFYVLVGPGRNMTYSEGYNDSNELEDSYKQTIAKL